MQETPVNMFVLILIQTAKDPFQDLHQERGLINLGLIESHQSLL